jgi:hypothetical protein
MTWRSLQDPWVGRKRTFPTLYNEKALYEIECEFNGVKAIQKEDSLFAGMTSFLLNRRKE